MARASFDYDAASVAKWAESLPKPARAVWNVVECRCPTTSQEAEERFVYGELRAAVATLEDRRRRIDAEISRRAASPELLPVVTSLSGIRGVSTLTAFAVECGDLLCFRDARVHVLRRPRAVGVVERRVDLEGALTKTGNAHVRRLLVEAAWHHERPLNASSRAQARSVVR